MKVGILLPIYNAAPYLEQCLLSVLSQQINTLEDSYQIYAVDDYSADNSISVLSEVAHAYTPNPLAGFEMHDVNKGFASTFNHCARLAIKDGCDAVFTLCNDDKLESDCIAQLIKALKENPDAAWASCYGQMFGEDSQVMKVNHEATLESLYDSNQLLSFALFRAETWKQMDGYNELIAPHLGLKSAYEDWDLWIRLIKAGLEYTVVPKTLYNYRIRPGQLHRELNSHHQRIIDDLHVRHYSK